MNRYGALLLLLLVAGCGTLPPADKVMLSAPPEHMNQTSHWRVMRVRTPEYLDNYDIRLRSHDYVITHLEEAKWAERLPAAMTRALQKNINQMLETHADRHLDIRVSVENFELQASDEAVLSAKWQATDKERTVVAENQVLTRKSVPAKDDPDAVGKAMSEAVRDLASDIVAVTEKRLTSGDNQE